MSLPRLTAFIGENVSKGNIFSSLVKPVKNIKENQQPYIVFLVLDLQSEEIYFKLHKKFNEDSIYEFYYFGNNSRNNPQYYLARSGKDIKYILTRTFNDLKIMLKQHGMENCELSNIINEMESKNMVSIGEKIGEGSLNFNKFSIIKEGMVSDIQLDKKDKLIVDNKKVNNNEFIRLFIDDSNKNNKYVLVLPVIKLNDNREVILSTHTDYLKLVKRTNNLSETISNKKNKKSKKRICYICKLEKEDVSSKYSTNFDSTGINKIFTTTNINTSPYLQNCDYDNVYSICKDCYQKLLSGEKIVLNQFKGSIAGEFVFIIPEGLLKDFDYKYLNVLKKNVDLAFSTADADNWLQTIETELEENDMKYYSINLIFYRTDGNSVKVLQTMEDVPTLRLKKVIQTISYNKRNLESHLKSMGLGSIYRIIPVKVNKNKEQLDVGRVLSLYKAILTGELIEHKILFRYALESLDKGLKQLSKPQIDNFLNMKLSKYNKYKNKEDYFIKDIIFSYIVLIKTCQSLELLDKRVFDFFKEEVERLPINTPSKDINDFIEQTEIFLDKHDFNGDARALFYLGILINRVAVAQFNKDHKTKPILKKIQFQGMNRKEAYRLYHDAIEKLRQYNSMTLFTEAVMNRFHYYFGTLDKEWTLNEHENVFYIMSGYSYLVGNKDPDLTKEEEEAVNESINEIEG